ncbi:hypothetical protein CDL15_Pgr006931 [Punica granatum]|uniref:Uncharacterized protein n=1 Tax=Punica granatum TaxID=22663 RepID=A0A218X868_PUNGR|nr:hypothetical protein CDL15_Pgr006931 [Punica granatum]
MRPNYWRILPGSFDCFLPKRQTAGRKSTPEMETPGRRGYAWAVGAGLNAALAAVSAKLIASQWFAGALLIVIGVVVLSKSSIESKSKTE